MTNSSDEPAQQLAREEQRQWNQLQYMNQEFEAMQREYDLLRQWQINQRKAAGKGNPYVMGGMFGPQSQNKGFKSRGKGSFPIAQESVCFCFSNTYVDIANLPPPFSPRDTESPKMLVTNTICFF